MLIVNTANNRNTSQSDWHDTPRKI